MATSAQLNVQVSSKGVKTTKTELKGLTTTGAKAEKQAGKLQDKFKSFGKNAGAAVASIDGPLGGISSRITALTTVATAGGAAVTSLAVAVTGLGFTLSKGISYLDEMNIALARSEALINATGGAAGYTSDQLQEQAKQVALNTLASVQGIQQAQSVLLTFGNVSGTVFSDAIGLSQDLATVFGGTAASAATQLGKALQDPTTGISALTRAGITFNDQQKEEIKILVKSGNALKAQSIIIETLKKQVQGVAAAISSESLAGSLDTFGQRFDELTEIIVKNTGALSTYQMVVDRIAKGMAKATEALAPDTAAEAAQKALDLLWEISDEEAALEKANTARAKNAIKTRISLLKEERQALLDYASGVAESENKAAIARLDASESAEKLQAARAKADKAASDAADLKSVSESSEVTAFKSATQDLLTAYDERSRLTLAKQNEAAGISGSGIQTTAEVEEDISYEGKLSSLDSYYAAAQEKAAGQGTVLAEIDSEYQRSVELLEQEHQDNLTTIRKTATETRIQSAQEEATELTAVYSNVAGAISGSFGTVADAISASGDESSSAYNAMWALSKGFATAQAALNFNLALTQAMADPTALTLAQKLANYAAVASSAGSLVSSISSINYSGRLQGGSANSGETYMTGERGPELVTFGRDGGSVQSNSQTQNQSSGSSKTNYTVVNQTTGTIDEVEQQNVTANDVVLILKQTMPAEIKNGNSSTSKSLSRNTNAGRKYR